MQAKALETEGERLPGDPAYKQEAVLSRYTAFCVEKGVAEFEFFVKFL